MLKPLFFLAVFLPFTALADARLEPLLSVMKELNLYPGSYAVKTHKLKAKKKNEIFKEWQATKIAGYPPKFKQYVLDYTMLDAPVSRDEEMGTFRVGPSAGFESAENFLYAKDLNKSQIARLQAAFNELPKKGIHLGFNGFDFACGQYVISPLFIDESAGELIEFKYAGGCR